VEGEASVDVDFTRASEVADWLPRLRDIEAAVNSVGIFRERGPQTFAAVHVQAPCALFDACVIAGIDCVINILRPGCRTAVVVAVWVYGGPLPVKEDATILELLMKYGVQRGALKRT
jgi:hypothetical protein